ncbi:MAG: 3-deoxy-manno-octulosonate cytidylyltransferase [Magnetococcales bacterium]|nr:3-deoxy-manno-octulosonate cytidylyltransferase [Magnetococcales bacterium]
MSPSPPPVLVVIPARYASSRLPGKPLARIAGVPMVVHVCRRAALAQVDRVLVAADDPRIVEAVTHAGFEAVMTRADHPSGTDRVAEAAREWSGIVVNVQGDEPLIDPDAIDAAVAPLREDPALPMSTLAHPLHDPDDYANPNVVKLVRNLRGDALYFSRLPIPFFRDLPLNHAGSAAVPPGVLRHIGLYAFRADFLQTFAQLPPTFLEQAEKLEQLRALEHGHAIRAVLTDHAPIGVDTPEDLERVRRLLAAENGG